MLFWNYGPQNTWLDIFLESTVSEDRSASNMVNLPKHC